MSICCKTVVRNECMNHFSYKKKRYKEKDKIKHPIHTYSIHIHYTLSLLLRVGPTSNEPHSVYKRVGE